MSRGRSCFVACCAGVVPLVLSSSAPAAAQIAPPPQTAGVGVAEHLGAQLPLELPFTTADGRSVRLGSVLAGEQPTVLVLAYYHCEMLCSLVLRGTADALREVGGLGADYRAVTLSIDPRDAPADARRARAGVLAQLGAPATGAAWTFLTGSGEASREVADAVGFRYRFDARSDQFAHPAVIFLLTPEGQVSRYLYGVRFPPEQLRTALNTAAQGDTGSSWDRVLTLCYHYVPALRRYASLVGGLLRGGALLILLAFPATVWTRVRRARRAEALQQ